MIPGLSNRERLAMEWNWKRAVRLVIVCVVFVYAFLLSITLPCFFRARMAANESVAVSVLRNVYDAEEAFKEAKMLDRDGDGLGEYASMDELFSEEYMGEDWMTLRKMTLPRHFGYSYAISVGGEDDSGSEDPDACERRFFAAAWPTRYERGGRRSFMVDETGVVRGSDTGGQPASWGDVGEESLWPALSKD